jgi:putative membrane protein
MNDLLRRVSWRSNGFLRGILVLYILLWIFLALDPFDRSDWLLENVLVFAGIAFTIVTYRTFSLSNFSFLLIAVFLCLHAVGAHYTYEQVPFGEWIKPLMGTNRNQYDRVVHFAFGLLLTFPIAEAIRHTTKTGWASALSLAAFVILAVSGLHEMIEALFASIISPALGQAYLGTQGDVWDAQKDMAAATAGSLIAMVAGLLYTRRSVGAGLVPARLPIWRAPR